jgi:hypothetical protein
VCRSVQVICKHVVRLVKSRKLVGWVDNVQLGREEIKHNFYFGGGGFRGGREKIVRW